MPPTNSEDLSLKTTTPAFQKLAGFQSFLPQFDAETVVTPSYFIRTLETICDQTTCTPEERLIVLKSKLRGKALSHTIQNPQFSNETNYGKFKEKFLNYFNKKPTSLSQQNLFLKLKMIPGETVKQFASRVEAATIEFLGMPNKDDDNEGIRDLIEKTKLTRFLEGMSPEEKNLMVIKNPRNLEEAVEFMEVIQENKNSNPSINNINDPQNELQNNKMMESIEELHNKIQNLTLTPEIKNNKHPTVRQSCQICHKNNHIASNCFYYLNQQTQPNNPGFRYHNSIRDRGRSRSRRNFDYRNTQQNSMPFNPNYRYRNSPGPRQPPPFRMNNPPQRSTSGRSPFRGRYRSTSRDRGFSPRVFFGEQNRSQNYNRNRNSENY